MISRCCATMVKYAGMEKHASIDTWKWSPCMASKMYIQRKYHEQGVRINLRDEGSSWLGLGYICFCIHIAHCIAGKIASDIFVGWSSNVSPPLAFS
jgi:hypothetical protein